MTHFKTLAALLLLSASLSAPAQANELDWAGQKFENLKSQEETLSRSQNGGRIIGMHETQKDAGSNGFCRKSAAVAPHAQPHYSCYTIELDGREARAAYNSSRDPETNVMFYSGNSPRLGQSWMEKLVDVRGAEVLCVKTSAVVPKPVPSFTCYSTRPPLGGGISIGN
jgi:hypothetical protein